VKSALSIAEARRIALAAQGFLQQDRNGTGNWSTMKRELKRLHLLQIDSVNVLCRSHYLPLFSRLGDYDKTRLDRHSLSADHRELFECWAHEASLVRMELHPLMRWRMARALNGQGIYQQMSRFSKENKSFLKKVLTFVETNGPAAQSDLPERNKGEGGWWGWSKNKLALETLFAQGLLTTAKRDGFERFYDIPARVIPANTLALPTPSEPDAMRALIGLSAKALGVGTAFDLRDYFRLPVSDAHRALHEAVEEGTLVPVSVEGWKQQAYLHRDSKLPRKAHATALVTPFDPIVWYRDRAERLFNFHYRIELYTPAPKRKFGYYVLPFLHGNQFAGRVCLKADRQTGTLRVNQSHGELPAATHDLHSGETAAALATELQRMARWLGLERIAIADRGSLAKALQARVNP
jgi:uncharacterized protein